MQTPIPQKDAHGSVILGIPNIAFRLVRSWFHSMLARRERRASLVSMGMGIEPGSFPEAIEVAGDQSRLL